VRTNYYLGADFTQPDTWQNSIGMKFAFIHKSAGNPDGEYWVGVYEVTQEEYAQVMGTNTNPSKVKGPRLPVQNVSWKDALDFCDRLLMREKNRPPAGMTHYTLPTETQWNISWEMRSGETLSSRGKSPKKWAARRSPTVLVCTMCAATFGKCASGTFITCPGWLGVAGLILL
jgi:hypothetical protein